MVKLIKLRILWNSNKKLIVAYFVILLLLLLITISFPYIYVVLLRHVVPVINQRYKDPIESDDIRAVYKAMPPFMKEKTEKLLLKDLTPENLIQTLALVGPVDQNNIKKYEHLIVSELLLSDDDMYNFAGYLYYDFFPISPSKEGIEALWNILKKTDSKHNFIDIAALLLIHTEFYKDKGKVVLFCEKADQFYPGKCEVSDGGNEYGSFLIFNNKIIYTKDGELFSSPFYPKTHLTEKL